MEFRITIDIFSGRKNPVIEMKGKEAERLYERLRPARPLAARELLPIPESTLGYRGLIIEASGARALPKRFRLAHGDLVGPRLSHRASDEDFESFIARHPALTRKLGKNFPSLLLRRSSGFTKPGRSTIRRAGRTANTASALLCTNQIGGTTMVRNSGTITVTTMPATTAAILSRSPAWQQVRSTQL
jgi:hypothetical protein